MAMGRFLVPALPFAAVLLAATLAGWRPRSQLGFAAAVVALNLLAVFDVLPVPRGIYDSYLKLIKEQRRFEIKLEDKKRINKQFGKMTKEAKDHRKKYKY
jgi:hypothetical protein